MVNTILISKNELCLDLMSQLCSEHLEINVLGKYASYMQALKLAQGRTVDFALIDYPDGDEDAIEFGTSLRRLNSSVVLIYFITQPQQSFEAVKIRADFCLIKPFSKYEFRGAVRRAYVLNKSSGCPVVMHMFGKFGVFCDGRAVKFKSNKAKELFALCADHCGAEVTIGEASDKLWGERPYDDKVKALYRKAVMNIRRTLEEYDIQNVFLVKRGSCGINPNNISCDYYKFRRSPIANIELYNGEYLSDYSWAEERAAMLHFQKTRLIKELDQGV
ncbi:MULTISPECIES: hypothetical protein [unclassified Ruminococcus]|uniref:hypothetical protein n=1 Tax=unclassified Ruminococcus TaxID=2608920 RepID=UPI00210CF2C4|nr:MULTISPECIES: hypothetical protein [unclassified Ruminococcus]MCQ4022967.1 response regulator [Ruminococcus sp. zg-924]MCQ4115335.1 response regulator [Ruminococcus sp. zg-921]